jgi:Tfp pilus assembly protein PilF/ADP-heptose:LPS heptosyltransferase
MTKNTLTQLEEAVRFHSINKIDIAEKIYEQIIKSDGKNFNALYLLGTIKAQRQNYNEAIKLIDKSLNINKNNYLAYSNLALIYFKVNQLDNAKINYHNSILLNPSYPESYNGLATVYLEQKKYLLSMTNYKKAAKLNKKNSTYQLNIVKLLLILQKYDRAKIILNKILDLDPSNYETHYTQGIIFKRLKEFHLSKNSFLKSIELNPHHEKSYNEIGFLFYLEKDFKNALHYMNKSVSINPAFKEGYLNIGMINLLNENFIEGWENFNKGREVQKVNTKKNLWTGQLNLQSKSIFIYSEQGLGDIIQFSRYLFVLKSYFKKIILKIPKSLIFLFSNINNISNGKIEFVTDFKKIDDCDFHLPLMSLTLFFKQIPEEINYFKIDEQLISKWSNKINKNNYNIGICWRAGKKKDLLYSEFATRRSFSLNEFSKIINLNNVKLINLQKEHNEDQKNIHYEKIKIFKEMDTDQPFLDSAAIIMNCNLIITCDTSIAHLAGTLGKKTYLLLDYNSDWRWGVNKDYSIWYKSIKIFRQDEAGFWDRPFTQVYNNIKSLL